MKLNSIIGETCLRIGEMLMLCLMCIIAFPFVLIYLIVKLLWIPADYIKYKTSLYQKDFPHKYSWITSPHTDSKFYNVIKKNNLPIEYIKWSEDYEQSGYFIYNNVLLEFQEPFFFDEKKDVWLFWPQNNSEEELGGDDEEYKNTDDCLTVDEAKKLFLEMFHQNVPNRRCDRVVVFYSRKNLENYVQKGEVEKLRRMDDIIVYEKDQLAAAIKKVTEAR